MLNILKILMVLSWLMVLGCVFVTIKNENAYHNRIIILRGIGDYINWRRKNNLSIDDTELSLYDSMEPYDRTLWRLGDWSYKNILPPDKYKIIKPFIRKG